MAEIDLSPGELDLVLRRGDSAFFQVAITDDDDVALDFTGYTWRAQVRETVDDADVLMSFDVDTAAAATGVLALDLDSGEWPAAATPEPSAKWFWDLEGTTGTSVRTYLAGKVTVKGDVSKA
jgi:hypothetical protein